MRWTAFARRLRRHDAEADAPVNRARPCDKKRCCLEDRSNRAPSVEEGLSNYTLHVLALEAATRIGVCLVSSSVLHALERGSDFLAKGHKDSVSARLLLSDAFCMFAAMARMAVYTQDSKFCWIGFGSRCPA